MIARRLVRLVTVALATAALLSATAASAIAPRVAEPRVTYAPPLAGPLELARRFERPPQPWAAGHRGVDLRTVQGAPVLAPADGVVSFAGSVAGRGVVTVAHPDGRRSSLEPVQPAVTLGERVAAGQQVGTVQPGGSHCAPGTCLHWGVRVGTAYVDPLGLLPGTGPVVLLPLEQP